MTTLHIEHPIRDYETWKAAFEREPHRVGSAGTDPAPAHSPGGLADGDVAE